MEIENRKKKQAFTNTPSADRVLRNTVMEPIALHKFTPYIYRYTTAMLSPYLVSYNNSFKQRC